MQKTGEMLHENLNISQISTKKPTAVCHRLNQAVSMNYGCIVV